MKITAHVPVQQYGFIEIEGSPEEEALILQAYNRYAETPVTWRSGTTVRRKAFMGGEIDWDEVNHTYSWNGEKYLSGSEYAKSKQKPFDAVLLSGKVAEKTGADPTQIAELWKLGGQVSRDFGTNVHLALELYGKYESLCDSLEKEYHLPNHPVLKDIVQSFYKHHSAPRAEYEVLVVDHQAKRAGTIDRLLIAGENDYTIEDFKITHKEDLPYWKDQLSFYEGIIKANGGNVIGKTIHQYNGAWKEIKL
jgi:hypothetical protein